MAGSDMADIDIDPRVKAALDGLPDDFAGFEQVYQSEIRPALLSREADRVSAIGKSRQYTLYGVLAALALGGGGYVLFREGIAAMVGMMAGFGIHALGQGPITRLKKEAKTLLVDPVVRRFDLAYTADCGPQPLINTMKALRLVPSWDRSSYEDRLTGQRQGTDFEFFEAHLEQRRTSRSANGSTSTRWVTVFRGQCIRFDFHKPFHGRTLVTRDMGLFNAMGELGSELKRARLESPDFEKVFEVYTSDQVEARFLLTPDVMQRLSELDAVLKGAKLRCCFDEGQLFVTLEGRNLFEPGSMSIRFDDPARVREILDNLSLIFRLMDDLGPRARSIREN